MNETVLNKLSRIRKSYRVLNESCAQLNSLYKIQFLAILGSLTLNVLFNLYFAIFGGFTRDTSTTDLEAQQVSSSMNDVIWSVYYFGRFLLVCTAAGQLMEEVIHQNKN
ncbi:hypothetical protein NQ314_004007 [Rhamnusium bicolor]|uniref:Uncharacterized protein n=1 Tax=Rhamnusium bicolor TaxID=1586634 RepID=A0AAV8ZMC4_9CUCU|nr:hypothetical protein NQ314_004007 [Rhamnusium bicolor]